MNTLQDWNNFLKDQKVIDQFASANNMVPRKHILSCDVLSFVQIQNDITMLSKYSASVLRDSLVEELHKVNNSAYISVFDTINIALQNEQSYVMTISKLNEELEVVKKQNSILMKENKGNLYKVACENNRALSFIYSSKLISFLFNRFNGK
jgi:hypothetical protein